MDCPEFQNNKHQVLINSKDIDRAFREIVLWGESKWWPNNCTMKFIRRGNSSAFANEHTRRVKRENDGMASADSARQSVEADEPCEAKDKSTLAKQGHCSRAPSIQKGTIYRQKVLLPFAPSWLTIVTEIIEKKSISRKFLNGLLEGQETISVSPCDERLKVEYLMNYKIKGRLNNFLWRLFFNKMHDNNIRLILDNLKEYLEKK